MTNDNESSPRVEREKEAIRLAVGELRARHAASIENALLILLSVDQGISIGALADAMKKRPDDASESGLLREALQRLYEETADYIRLNNLGDVHHNRSMQMARAALALTGQEKRASASNVLMQEDNDGLPERANGNAGSTPARLPRFGKGKEGSNPSTRDATVASRPDGSGGMTAGKDRQSFPGAGWMLRAVEDDLAVIDLIEEVRALRRGVAVTYAAPENDPVRRLFLLSLPEARALALSEMERLRTAPPESAPVVSVLDDEFDRPEVCPALSVDPEEASAHWKRTPEEQLARDLRRLAPGIREKGYGFTATRMEEAAKLIGSRAPKMEIPTLARQALKAVFVAFAYKPGDGPDWYELVRMALEASAPKEREHE